MRSKVLGKFAIMYPYKTGGSEFMEIFFSARRKAAIIKLIVSHDLPSLQEKNSHRVKNDLFYSRNVAKHVFLFLEIRRKPTSSAMRNNEFHSHSRTMISFPFERANLVFILFGLMTKYFRQVFAWHGLCVYEKPISSFYDVKP